MRNSRILTLTRAALAKTPLSSSVRHFATCRSRRRAFQEGDVVLLKDRKNTYHEGTLVKLHASKNVQTHRGSIPHAHVIGKEPRQLVQSSKGASYRIHEPTLAEYVRLTPRLVTPIYPSDTNIIVSLLDIHVDRPSGASDDGPPLEILEAGTGHGALTLHLARAIHAGNPPLPNFPSYTSSEEKEDPVYGGESLSDLRSSSLELWKQSRRAIIYTLDISSKHSAHAKKIVEGFRGGMYAGDIDFHVGDVSHWIAHEKVLRKTEEPFLSHVFLDMPNADQQLANVAPVLHVNGLLAVFNPSITQIVECVETIRKHKMPYLLDQVVELGASTIREWDVRAVKPRATLGKPEVRALAEAQSPTSEAPIDPIKGQEARDNELAEDLAKDDEKWAMVCRPKVGQQVVGGGFLGLWRRMEKSASTPEG
ncbi:S-adenosyl-L-methionine-dependent methyltransferase [Lentithecium fluviatile CBS 122367]|uniref:tRNA (adenine(58)-N(1))-methyltransferase catalytic subunit TRM61 n=1 Tax=Lentithecium fluviatile CBS 122367 TaxID=1168545 RepID=A0A6G1JM60_9PLEO|nr:S-adenosyl-L-methionine-dependent methyltransferase [Lentithecium fluviatile CBS 122367]